MYCKNKLCNKFFFAITLKSLLRRLKKTIKMIYDLPSKLKICLTTY